MSGLSLANKLSDHSLEYYKRNPYIRPIVLGEYIGHFFSDLQTTTQDLSVFDLW